MPAMDRPTKRAEEVFRNIMGQSPNEPKKFSVRKPKDTYEKQGHMIQGNVDIQRNVYEK